MRAVLFDLYKTLVDIETDESEPIVWRHLVDLLEQWGGVVHEPAELESMFHETVDRLSLQHGAGVILWLVVFEILQKAEVPPLEWRIVRFVAVFRRSTRKQLSVRDYTGPVLRDLRANDVRTGIVSNTESLVTECDLTDAGLEGSTNTIVFSSRIGIQKPDPAIFQAALDALDVQATETVMIGDNPDSDVNGAASAGMATVLLTTEAPMDTFTSQQKPQHLWAYPSLSGIRSALTRHGFLPDA